MKVAISVKHNSAGVHWTEDELKMKQDSLINSKKYSASQQSLLKQFFTTISDYGGPEVGSLSDILVDEFGETKRYVSLISVVVFFSSNILSDVCLTCVEGNQTNGREYY